jgi:hypothetical protein
VSVLAVQPRKKNTQSRLLEGVDVRMLRPDREYLQYVVYNARLDLDYNSSFCK